MRTRIVLSLALILTYAFSTHPQRKKQPPPKQIAVVQAPQVKIEYDRFKDRTSVALWPMKIPLQSEYLTLELVVVTTYPGQELPDSLEDLDVLIAFTSRSHEWQFQRNTNLIAILDGERQRFGTMTRESDTENGLLVEDLRMMISEETLATLANSKTVEMQLGNVEFKLGENHLQGLKEFVARLHKSKDQS